MDNETVAAYLGYLTESFLFKCAKRYDVKGKRYFEYPSKYYCMDLGLRNARLNFRQQEESHIMENIIYNELSSRGYVVDVGVVKLNETDNDGKLHQNNCEIDFVINRGMKRYYIQDDFFWQIEVSAFKKTKSGHSIRVQTRRCSF